MAELFNEADSSVFSSTLYDKVVGRVMKSDFKPIGCERDERIILRWILRKLEGVVGTGWSWLRIGTGGGLLWVR
jgi:hypothetical protein